jgi:phospholipid/cholesterol/gamma-HCH transport system ATP-binding protein
MSELSKMEHPAIRQFFDGPRGRAAAEQELRQTGTPTAQKSAVPS